MSALRAVCGFAALRLPRTYGSSGLIPTRKPPGRPVEHLAREFRAGKRYNAAQGKAVCRRVVDPEQDSGGAVVTRFRYQVAHRRRPAAEGITEMPRRDAELVFKRTL